MDRLSRLLAVGVVSSDVTSGPSVITTEDHCFLGYRGQMEPHSSELVGLLVKGVLAEPLLSLRRTVLAPGGGLSPAKKVFKMSKPHNIQRIKIYEQYKAALGFSPFPLIPGP